jgi:hypothetical protein
MLADLAEEKARLLQADRELDSNLLPIREDQPRQQQQTQQRSQPLQQPLVGPQLGAETDEQRILQQLAALRLSGGYGAEPALAASAEQLPHLTNGNIGTRLPQTNARAKELLEQEAGGMGGLGTMPLGKLLGSGLGGAPGAAADAGKLQLLARVKLLGSTYSFGNSGRPYGQYARVPLPVAPQHFAEQRGRPGMLPGTVSLDALTMRPLVQFKPETYTTKPAKLVEKMPTQQAWMEATQDTIAHLVGAGVVTDATWGQWDVFCATQMHLANYFLLKQNWGGFLAGNHACWVAMWARGLQPDADNGVLPVC